LADWGADVIKIEPPEALGPSDGGGAARLGPDFQNLHRNKRSLTLNLKEPEALEIFRKLADQADVIIENFRPDVKHRLGIDYETLAVSNPRLVYASVSGFGQDGPYAARAGYDYLAQGMGGMMSLTGEPDGPPMKIPVANADLVTGMYAAVAILAALRHRDATGRGQHVDMALLDCQVAWMCYAAENVLVSGAEPRRLGNGHPTIVPYQVFAAADGHLILAVGNDSQFAKFCAFAGRPDLAADERFRTNAARVGHREILLAELTPLIAARPRAHWLDGLEPLGVPAGPVNTLPQALADPQIGHRGLVRQASHPGSPDPVPLLTSPVLNLSFDS
jgi:crotonobetainyl-CoA:carnitine CoA-transferase CaiB-like acyl-CoA transferase